MISAKLLHYFPNDKWSLAREDYAALEWFGPSPKPSEADIAALAWPVAHTPKEQQSFNRYTPRELLEALLASFAAGGIMSSAQALAIATDLRERLKR